MIYRPQYAYPTPRGFTDEQFSYTFDQSNTPFLNSGNLASGSFIQNIPLPLDRDAAFLWRGFTILGVNDTDPVMAVRFRDAAGNYLSDDFVPIDLYARPLGLAIVGTLTVIWEPQIECPAGGMLWVDLKNQSNGAVNTNLVRLTLDGAKRRKLAA
jgi:hypothetical protein